MSGLEKSSDEGRRRKWELLRSGPGEAGPEDRKVEVGKDFVGELEPFFLVGSERSGTTLLRLMLSHHPRIACAPEFEFLVDHLRPDGSWPALAEYREYLATNRVFQPHGLEIDPDLDYPALARSFVVQFGERAGKDVVGATCHHVFHLLPRIWSRARYVHLLRDGRDVARSCIGMGWAGNVWYGAQRWIEAQACWNRLTDRVSPERLLEIRYEDLVTDTEGTLTRVCEFLGVAFDPAVFDYVEASTYERPDPSLIQQWRRKLSPDELALLEARIGAMLRMRGYEPSGVDPARVGPWRRFKLYLENRAHGFRFRSGRYGLGNVLLSYAARKLGLHDVERRMSVERNTIDNQHLK